MRQERLEILECFGSRDQLEDPFEVGPGFEIVGLGGFDEAIEIGAGFGATNRVGDHPVFSADGEGANGVLDEIRVEWNFAMLEHAHQFRPLSVQIRESCSPSARFGLHGPLG